MSNGCQSLSVSNLQWKVERQRSCQGTRVLLWGYFAWVDCNYPGDDRHRYWGAAGCCSLPGIYRQQACQQPEIMYIWLQGWGWRGEVVTHTCPSNHLGRKQSEIKHINQTRYHSTSLLLPALSFSSLVSPLKTRPFHDETRTSLSKGLSYLPPSLYK